jgi:hypothetical protein
MKRKISVAVLAAVLLVAMVGTVAAGELRAGQSVPCYVSGGYVSALDCRAEVKKVDKYGKATVKFYHENTSGNFIGWCTFTVKPYYVHNGSSHTRHDDAQTVSEFVQGNKLTKGSFTLSGFWGNIDGFDIEVNKK